MNIIISDDPVKHTRTEHRIHFPLISREQNSFVSHHAVLFKLVSKFSLPGCPYDCEEDTTSAWCDKAKGAKDLCTPSETDESYSR